MNPKLIMIILNLFFGQVTHTKLCSEKMETETIESIMQAIKKLQQEQRNMMAKFTKLTEVFKNKFSKLNYEKAFEEKCTIMQKDIEDLRKEQVSLSENVSNIETERDLINKKIESIEDALEKTNKQIDAHDKIDDAEEMERKQCRFDNAGYCHQSESCNVFHATSTCEIYLETGTCWRKNCCQRHPKVCRYGEG